MVSVIIPAYNMEKYLGKSLDSVIAQTYKNLEVIIVDDGSMDTTLEIAQRYAMADKRIKVYHKENGGVSSARNHGIEQATGEYIFFFDPDDLMEVYCIEVLVRAMEDAGADMVSCQYSRWDDAGTRLEDYGFIVGERVFSSEKDRISFLIKELLDYHVGFEVWDKLFKTDIIKEKNVRFPDKCRIGEDLAFNIKYLMHVSKMNNVADRCIRYTIRNDSAMGSHKKLSDKISEDMLLTMDVWEYAGDYSEKSFFEQFPVLFVKMIEHSYVGHSPCEIVEAIKEISDISFMEQRYTEIDAFKDEIISIYPAEIAKIKYRYHLMVRTRMANEGDIGDRFVQFFYDCYRRLRGREPLERWKMPY